MKKKIIVLLSVVCFLSILGAGFYFWNLPKSSLEKDFEKPSITCQKKIEVGLGSEIDLLQGVVVKDNSNEEITPTVEGDYNLDEVGEYTIYYVAKDSSGNVAREEAKLFVYDKVFTTLNEFQGIVKDGATYIDGVLIVNKTYSLPKNFGNGLTSETEEAFTKMCEDAEKEGLHVYMDSGFRSYEAQEKEYHYYSNRDGVEKADTYSARPGYSEHQSGYTIDVNSNGPSFNHTPEAEWLDDHCYEYGFIVRYPEGKTDETGYTYESWHFRYVGKELATKLYNQGDWITLEAYFGITSAYAA